MNNSLFGKTMENLRKRVEIKLVKTDGSENEKLRKIKSKPNFNRRVKFSDELSAIQVNKTKLTLNKTNLYKLFCLWPIKISDVRLVLQQ